MRRFWLALLWPAAALAADLPDPAMTPGAINPVVRQETIATTICVPGWSATQRPSAAYTGRLKREQLAAAGDPSAYEEDHLISIELGGHPTDPRNLWPQLWLGPWGAHRKDRLENALHRAVCAGRVPLAEAQAALATDWKAAYCRYLNEAPCPRPL